MPQPGNFENLATSRHKYSMEIRNMGGGRGVQLYRGNQCLTGIDVGCPLSTVHIKERLQKF